MLQARILRTLDNNEETLIGAVVLSDYSMVYDLSEEEMNVDIKLKFVESLTVLYLKSILYFVDH